MAITTRVLIAVLSISLAVACLSIAQNAAIAQAATKPSEATPKPAPVTFKGTRATDVHAPTPQFEAIAAGLFARPIVDTQSAKGDVAIRVWSLSVSPKTNTVATTLPGAAMLSLTSGIVEFIAGDVRRKLQPGDTAAIPEGAALRFINDSERPAMLRAVIVASR